MDIFKDCRKASDEKRNKTDVKSINRAILCKRQFLKAKMVLAAMKII